MSRLGIAVIVAGLMVVIFAALFGFPSAPPKPAEIVYYDPVPAAPYDPKDVKAPCEGSDKDQVIYLHDGDIQRAGGDAGLAIIGAMDNLPDCGGTVDFSALRGDYDLRQTIVMKPGTALIGSPEATLVVKNDLHVAINATHAWAGAK